MMRQLDYVHRGDEYMPSTLKNAHFYALDIKILPAAHRRRAPAPARGPFSFLVHPRANRPARKRGFREMRGEIIVLQEVKDQRREKSIKENALFQASNRRFSPAGAAAALWAQRAHPGGTRGLLLVQLRANRLLEFGPTNPSCLFIKNLTSQTQGPGSCSYPPRTGARRGHVRPPHRRG